MLWDRASSIKSDMLPPSLSRLPQKNWLNKYLHNFSYFILFRSRNELLWAPLDETFFPLKWKLSSSQLAEIIFFMILRCISMTTIKSHRDIFAGDEFWWLTRAKVRHCLLCESRALSPRGSWVRIQIGRPTRNSVKILILIWKLVTQTGKRIVKLWCRDKCVEWGTIDVPT